MSAETLWLIVGFTGQACFFMRFLVQWLSSEREGRSVIPVAFWYFSLAGGAIVLVYAIYRKDPVFIVGQTTGVFIYLRNLALIRRERQAAESDLAPSDSTKVDSTSSGDGA
ncbi:MAG: lipid-A-disaccharide synthase N-terminal domain-containing protein [Thermoanaerobaculia bacterium]|nr:lipid-A-disaccharide synthase N-terminal domain-containing protein [Thermoanaerobaculia bacterium]